jgi:hypothetical protein
MGSTFDAKKFFPDQLESLQSIHYVLTYNPNKNPEELSRYREYYLHNLEVNGLTLLDVEGKDCQHETADTDIKGITMYVLIETPLDVFFDIAEKLKLKLPIAENDLHEPKIQKLYDLVTPEEIKAKKGRSYFTAAYEARYHCK